MTQNTQTLSSPISLVERDGPGFRLDRAAATRVIADLWNLDPSHSESWWIGAFGNGLADSIETLSRVVFSPRRGLISGPALEILILPVMPDSPAHPLMVGVVDGDGPIVCRGVEDIVELLPDAFGQGPEHVLAALEALLEVASTLIGEVEQRPAPAQAPTFSGFQPPVGQEARLTGI